MSGINTGKQLEYEVSASLRNIYDRTEEFWFKRYPDHRDWIAINKKLRAPRAPADFIALCRGVFIAIEAKSTKGPRFTFSWLKDHQLASLMDIEDAGGKSYILFSKRRGDQDDRKTPIQAWAIPIRAYERMEIALLNLKRPRKSAKIAEMAEIGIELTRLPGSMWDFTPLIEDALNSKQTKIEVET